MTETNIQDALLNLIETLLDAREEVQDDDNVGTLADFTRDMVDDTEKVLGVETFEQAGLLTSNAGIVVRTADGSQFQISII